MTGLRIMYDSDNIDAIPDTAEIVAFYCDGEPGTASVQQLERFAGKTLVPITRRVGVTAKVVDIEPGCVWPPDQAYDQIKNGLSDTAYFDESNRQAVEAALNGLVYHKWVAAYPGVGEQLQEPDDAAHQYANSNTSGGHYDLSVVSDTWPVNTTTGGQVTNVEPATPAQDSQDQPLEDADANARLQAPIVDAVYFAGGGYMVAADGGVFPYGNAVYHGSIPQLQQESKMGALHAAICTILAVDNRGYTLVAEDGGTFMFGTGPQVNAL